MVCTNIDGSVLAKAEDDHISLTRDLNTLCCNTTGVLAKNRPDQTSICNLQFKEHILLQHIARTFSIDFAEVKECTEVGQGDIAVDLLGVHTEAISAGDNQGSAPWLTELSFRGFYQAEIHSRAVESKSTPHLEDDSVTELELLDVVGEYLEALGTGIVVLLVSKTIDSGDSPGRSIFVDLVRTIEPDKNWGPTSGLKWQELEVEGQDTIGRRFWIGGGDVQKGSAEKFVRIEIVALTAGRAIVRRSASRALLRTWLTTDKAARRSHDYVECD